MVRTLDTLKTELEQTGHDVVMLTPDRFHSIPCPTYPEIRLALAAPGAVARIIAAAQPCAIHIATEGPLGWAARRWCRRHRLPFTSAYHTRFPEYVQTRWGIPLGLSYCLMRHFHAASARVMVATDSISAELTARGFTRLGRWSRGVDTDLFRPRPDARGDLGPLAGLPRPIFLSVGRVAVEKNIEAFLRLDLPGTKVVVGDGPQLQTLRRRHPEVTFAGARQGEDLARHYAAADVFVFPSRTDTFGLVLLEALASGLPVAAFPVPGPLDVLAGSAAGILDGDLAKAALAALGIDRDVCRQHASRFSWRMSAQQFLDNLQPFDSPQTGTAAHLARIACNSAGRNGLPM